MSYTKRVKITKISKSSNVKEKLLGRLEKSLKEIIEEIKGDNMNKVTGTPVKHHSIGASIAREVESSTNFEREVGEIGYDEPINGAIDGNNKIPENIDKLKLCQEEIGSIKFADQIKIDFIPSIDYRILCRFLGATTVNDIKNHPYQAHPLITLMLMESIEKFMKSENFNFVGELNFDCHGNSIPPDKNPWFIQGKETAFTTTGFLYFESQTKKREDNVAFFLFADLEKGGASIICYSTDTNKSKNIINDLKNYAKQHNCLRGAKLKDINVFSASFSEVEIDDKYSWDNYYFPDNIKELFDLEVLGFMNNVEKYNACGINKRGIILAGKPGTGKSTIGNIICNLIPDNTVIWITPEIISENNYRAVNSIKALYQLADFLSPCIILLEDLDLFSQDREHGGDLISLGALMNILDGINSISNSITIGTTNRLSSIEEALKNRPGRFDRIIEVLPLSKELRIKMFKNRLSKWSISTRVLNYLVGQTNDWTGAEIQELVNSLNLKHISSNRKNMKVDRKWAEEIIETMGKFGVGAASSDFGFGKKS